MQPQNNIPEEWRPVVGWEGGYSVSSLGGVRRDSPYNTTKVGRLLRGSLNQNGYRLVRLSMSGRTGSVAVAKLVGDAFLGPRPTGCQRNHKDGNKLNNAASNIEYVTPRENVLHSYKEGLASNKGEQHPRAKLTDALVREIRSSTDESAALAARLGISYHTVWDVRRGRSWKHVT